jgi:polysaccharide pyruvyl transferase WcaK-like protein
MKTELDHVSIWGTSVSKVGDEAQLASILSFFKQYNPDIEVTVFSRLSDKVIALLQQAGIRGDCNKLIDIIYVYRRLKKADALIIIGGPFFETWRQMLSIYVLLLLAKLTKTKVITFATTLFPLHTTAGKIFYRYACSRLSIISSRDDKAKQVLRANGINKPLYPLIDPRYMLQPSGKNHVNEILRAEGVDPDKPYIAITTRHLHDDMPDWVKHHHEYTTEIAQQSYANLAAVFGELAKKYQLVIVPMHPSLKEDYATAELLFSAADSNCTVLKKRYTPFDIIGIFQGSQFSIQSRLGSTVFSVVAGSPFVAISYESRMANWMSANGLSEYCVDWRKIEPEEVLNKIQALSENRNVLKNNFETMKKDKQMLFLSQSEKILTDLALVDQGSK